MYFLIIILFLELNSSDVIDDKMYRRARHVITENERTSQAVKALKSKSIEEFGHLMNESHNSLRYVQQASLYCYLNIHLTQYSSFLNSSDLSIRIILAVYFINLTMPQEGG